MRGIVLKIGNKGNGVMCKEEAKVRIVVMLSSYPKNKKEVSSLSF